MAIEPAGDADGARLHRAARVEDRWHALAERRRRRRGWTPAIVPYPGYGGPGWARVLARVVLTRATRSSPAGSVRGWRQFTTLPVTDAAVVIQSGSQTHETRTDRGGYIDTVVEAELSAGWASVRLSAQGAEPVDAPVRVVDSRARFGIVSDIDDTVMVTALPRPLLAAWNTFVLDEHARAAVPGMAVLYERLVNAHSGSPVVYLSTGAWNVAPTLTRFMSRHLYPAGPMLLTDWGPTADSLFRSGPAHKRASLNRLASDFPDIQWLLVGDDGQHDEAIYRDFAGSHPDHVAAVAIRRLSPTQSVLAGGLPVQGDTARSTADTGHPWVSAPDGAGLWRLLHEAGLV